MFDDDDLMLADHIGRLARYIREGADICSTGYWYADPDPWTSRNWFPGRRRHALVDLDWVTCWPDSSLSMTVR